MVMVTLVKIIHNDPLNSWILLFVSLPNIIHPSPNFSNSNFLKLDVHFRVNYRQINKNLTNTAVLRTVLEEYRLYFSCSFAKTVEYSSTSGLRELGCFAVCDISIAGLAVSALVVA